MYPSITIAYGPGYTQTMIDFIGFDYRDFGSGHCALRDYVDGYTNPTTGEFIETNNGGQWSRQSIVTIYPNFKTYSAIRDEIAANRARRSAGPSAQKEHPMTRQQINLSITDETRDQLDMLVTATRKQTGQETSRTTIITVLVKEAASRMKRIERVMDGRKLLGFNGYYGDHQVAYEEKTEAQAQAKIDAYAFEELSR